MTTAVVRYRDVDYADTLCPHLTSDAPMTLRLEKWATLRGQPVRLDAGSFRRGECAGCDSWMLADVPGRAATRGTLELGD